jgi:hypothetical protein
MLQIVFIVKLLPQNSNNYPKLGPNMLIIKQLNSPSTPYQYTYGTPAK